MRLDRKSGAAVGLAAFLAILCVPARPAAEDRTRTSAAEMRAAGQAGVPTIEVYSRETVVDVTVLDADGKPVHGLKQDDFTVLEDGKAQAVRSFAEFGAGAQAATVASTPEKFPANTYTNRGNAAAANGAVNIFVLDAANTGPLDQMRTRKYMAEYLAKMPPGTRVALLALGNELKFVQGFTTDREVLIAAIRDMKNSATTPGSVNGPPCMAKTVKTRLTLEALRQISALVMNVKGKKNVLWFTGQMDVNPSPMADCDLDYPGLDETLDMLTAAQVTVYTIDASIPQLVLSAQFGAGTPSMMQPTSAYGGILLDLKIVPKTGGRHLHDAYGPGAIGTAIEEGSNYYTITYVPAHGEDGNLHHIAVKVNQKGLTLMYRPEYGADNLAKAEAESRIPTTLNAVTPEPERNTMRASMARFAPVATQVLFDVKVTAAAHAPGPAEAAVVGFPVAAVKDKPMVRYELTYSVPAEQMALRDGEDGMYHGAVEFDVVASDVFGTLLTSVSRTIPLTLDAEGYAEFVKQPLRVVQQIDLPAGQMYVRVGVLDKVSNKVGTVEVPVTVAKMAGTVRAGAK